MCSQVHHKSGSSHILLTSKTDVNLGLGKKRFRSSVKKCVSTGMLFNLSKRTTQCLCSRKTPGDIFHIPHIKAQIFDLQYRRPRQSCWKRHSPIYKQGFYWPRRVAERVKQSERVCVGGLVGVESPSPVSGAEQRVGARITLRWPLLSLELFQVGVKVFLFLFLFCFLEFVSPPPSVEWNESRQLHKCQCPTPFKSLAPFWYEWRCGAVMVPLLCQWS